MIGRTRRDDRCRRTKVIALLTAILGAFSVSPGYARQNTAASSFILGPVRDAATLVQFGADAPGTWTTICGQNVQYAVTPGSRIPGLRYPVLEARVWQKDFNDQEGSHTWFSLSRKNIPPKQLPADIDGFRIVLGSDAEAHWWISPSFTTDEGETFSVILDANPFPAQRLVQWVLPFDRFRNSKNEPLTAEKARRISGISFATSSAGTSLLFDSISVYRRERLFGWLDFGTSHPTNNLFQRNEPVSILFEVGGTPPSTSDGFRYEVQDYYGKTVARGASRLTDIPRHGFLIKALKPCQYSVRAYLTDKNGKDLQTFSCIRGEGSLPNGLGTFAVLPNTLAENLARSRKLGEGAFFGLHGDFLQLADYIGLTWRFDYTKWPYLEPTKPDRSSGMAPWARKALSEPAMPPYRFHIQPFILNGDAPDWAKTSTGTAPGFAWENGLDMVRDTVRVEIHRYPQMKHRLYGGLWEVDLNAAPYGTQKPAYSPTNITDAYRRIRDVVKAEDPGGFVIGPCSSVIRPDWFEEVFKAGVLNYVDGIETHAYSETGYTPEADDLPGRVRKLNALILKYHHGTALPIYVTETSQPGILGTDVDDRSQAERMVRTCIILKGEGIRVFLPFYGIDFDRTGYWGFSYNLDLDSPSGPWSTKRTSPKPMVNAVATCVNMLEGAEPEGQLSLPDHQVRAYRFRRGNTVITALWSPFGTRKVSLPSGGSSVKVTDMMGRSMRVAQKRRIVRFAVGAAPVYMTSLSTTWSLSRRNGI